MIKEIISIVSALINLTTADVPVNKPIKSCSKETPEQTLLREMLEERVRNNPIGAPKDLKQLDRQEFEQYLNDIRPRRYFAAEDNVGFENIDPLIPIRVFNKPEEAEEDPKDKLEKHESEHKKADAKFKESKNRAKKRAADLREASFIKMRDSVLGAGHKHKKTMGALAGFIENELTELQEVASDYNFQKSLKERVAEVKTQTPNGGGAIIVLVESPPGTWTSHISATGRTQKEALEKYNERTKDGTYMAKGAKTKLVWAEKMLPEMPESSLEKQNSTPSILSLPKTNSEQTGTVNNQFPKIMLP